MNFYKSVFPEKNFFENICKKGRFWGNYPSMFTLRAMTSTFLYLDYICHKSVELQRDRKHLIFGQFFTENISIFFQ